MNPYPSDHVQLLPEVADALGDNRPVVALESTIIAHGMPYPRNVETALRVEQEVRGAGAVPATIALLNGKIKIGLTPEEIERIGQGGATVAKASRRDLPYLLMQKKPGATTVAATLIGAGLARIPVFATGGIGGVHRGGGATFDISADLPELARTNVAVVSAGAKSILDLPATLEYLETSGVPVVGFGTNEFPAFYTRTSGLAADLRLDDPAAIAELLRLKWELGILGGVLVANPIPEAHALDSELVNRAIDQALSESNAQSISGKALTPFLLRRIEQITGGLSLEANIELVCNNARLAARIALALAESG